MKFYFDNNLSPHLAGGLRELSKGSGGLATDVIHLRDRFAPATPDHEWIGALATEGSWAIISQDGFRKNDLEREALRKIRLGGVRTKQAMVRPQVLGQGAESRSLVAGD